MAGGPISRRAGPAGRAIVLALLFAAWSTGAGACGWYGDGESDDDDDVVWVDAEGRPLDDGAAADPVDPRVLTRRAGRYRNGDGVSRDFPEALRLYRQAAEAGFAPAQNNLAVLYEKGLGTAVDLAAAARWYRAAAAQGNAAAAHSLGEMLLSGRGVDRDRGAGLAWIRKAAEGGHPSAMLQLGDRLASGADGAADPAGAQRWWKAAARRGNARAAGRLASAGAPASAADTGASDPAAVPVRVPAPEAVRRLAGGDLQVLDVRTAEEYVYGGHLAGAINVPVLFLRPRWDARAGAPETVLNPRFVPEVLGRVDPSRPVMVVCRTGMRSAYAVKRLRAAGVRVAFDVQGGMVAWRAAGGAVAFSLERARLYLPEDG